MTESFIAQLQEIVDRLSPEFRLQGQQEVNSLLAAGVASYDDLLLLVQDSKADTNLRSIAAWSLARLAEERAVPALINTLDYATAELRAEVVRALGYVGESQAEIISTVLIEHLLSDVSTEVRVASAHALGLLGQSNALHPLSKVLGSPNEDPHLRGMAAEALADLRDRRAVVALMATLFDSQPEVRFWSAFALGELGDPRALPELERLSATDSTSINDLGTIKGEAEMAIQKINLSSQAPSELQ